MEFASSVVIYCLCFLIGCIVGYSELISRYKIVRDLLKIRSAYFYLLLNGSAAVLALALLDVSEVKTFGLLGESAIARVLVAATAAMVILRSNIASITSGQRTISAGLGAITGVFLDAVDRAFDQRKSQMDLNIIAKIMATVDFEKAKESLPITCLTLMYNVSSHEQNKLGYEVSMLARKADVDNRTKALSLGIILNRITGTDLLTDAVKALSVSILVGSEVDQSNERQRLNELKATLSAL